MQFDRCLWDEVYTWSDMQTMPYKGYRSLHTKLRRKTETEGGDGIADLNCTDRERRTDRKRDSGGEERKRTR